MVTSQRAHMSVAQRPAAMNAAHTDRFPASRMAATVDIHEPTKSLASRHANFGPYQQRHVVIGFELGFAFDLNERVYHYNVWGQVVPP